MDGFLSKNVNAPRQKLLEYYRLNRVFYIVKTCVLLEKRDIYERNAYAYCMPQERSVDIDTELDFCIAKAVMDYYAGNELNDIFYTTKNVIEK